MSKFSRLSQVFGGGANRQAALDEITGDIRTFLNATGLRSSAGLAIDAVPEKFKTTLTSVIQIAGVTYSKAPETAHLFSAAHAVTASKFGIILFQRDRDGVITTKVPASPQAYNTIALARAAKPAPDAGNVELGSGEVAAKAALWTANTDDMTNGSDLTTFTFVNAALLTPPVAPS